MYAPVTRRTPFPALPYAGDEAEVPIDISDLPLEEAVVKLQNQNQAVLAKNRQLKASSDKHFEENTLLKQQLMDLRTYVKEVEQERANMQDRFHRTQIQHKCDPRPDTPRHARHGAHQCCQRQ